MYWLLVAYFLPDASDALLRTGLAIGFGLVPFYVQFGVELPSLLLHTLLSILWRRDSWTDWLYLLFSTPVFEYCVDGHLGTHSIRIALSELERLEASVASSAGDRCRADGAIVRRG